MNLIYTAMMTDYRQNGQNFMDITNTPDLGTLQGTRSKPKFPEAPVHQDELLPLMKNLSKSNIQETLEVFTSFHTRYYKSESGAKSSAWLLETITQVIADAGADEHGVKAEPFAHPWGQNSIIVTIPGQSDATVVIGAHQDSINLFLPAYLPAPGADDDGSGSMTILEALRVLLTVDDVVKGKARNTIEFHWYSAEEGGLLGSQAIFSHYAQEGRDVKAMLQQDMTGFIRKTIDAGEPESVGVITDFVDEHLTEFIKTIITEVRFMISPCRSYSNNSQYCDVPYVLTKCGYACSDHASSSKYGYPSAFVIESTFANSDDHIHGTEDKIKYLSFDHMIQHAKLTLGLVYELGFASL